MSEIEDTLAERDYGTSEDDLEAYARAGGAIGGAAACAAAGAAVLSPLCAEIGGWLAAAIFEGLASVFGSSEAAEREATEAQERGWTEFIAANDRAAAGYYVGAITAIQRFGRANGVAFDTIIATEPWASLPHGGRLCDTAEMFESTCFSALPCWRAQQFGPGANDWLELCKAEVTAHLEAYRRRVLGALVETLSNVAAVQTVPIALRYAMPGAAGPLVLQPAPDDGGGGGVFMLALGGLGVAAYLTRRRSR